MRPEHVAGELVADRDVVEQPLVVTELLDLVDVTDLDLLELVELVVGPLGFAVTAFTGEQLLVLRLDDLVPDRGRPLLGHPLAPLVDVDRVAPLEAGGAGELGVADLVVVGHAVADEVIAADDAGPKNHHSSPPKMRCDSGILPTCAGEQPWLVSVQR